MKRCVTLFAMALLLTGCASVAREPDHLALVRVLGIDGSKTVTLTAVCGSDSNGETGRGSAEAESFETARRAVVWSGMAEELALTGVSYLVVGPDVDLEAVLFTVLEDAELGATATVWLAEGGAAALLNGCGDPNGDLERLTLQKIEAPTVAQAVAALTTDGWVDLPCLIQRDGRLEEWRMSRWEKSD